jgi:DNA repair photolyase
MASKAGGAGSRRGTTGGSAKPREPKGPAGAVTQKVYKGGDPATVYKGRGATANPPSRFLARVSEAVDDGWAAPVAADDPEWGSASLGPDTQLQPDRTVTLITRNQSPDVPFDRSINPYKGCEHGCVYCFARPTHAYLDLSPGLDFETRIFYKTGVRERLTAELAKPGYRCAVLAMGTNTDPYQPAERTLRITRTVLEVLREHRHPVSIVTKGQLILRDLDILSDMAADGLAAVAVSVTTLDRGLKTALEPRTADPAARLRVIRALSGAGVPTRALMAPVIPFVNDGEIERIAAAVKDAGAVGMGYILLRLPREVEGLVYDWLKAHFPDRAERVMAAIRGAHGGKAYDATWGKRMRGDGPIADLIAKRYEVAIKRHGLSRERMGSALRTDLFAPPGPRQQSLFD